jgi:DHA1 family bicyclomycin/chloramphenicol resistance-like MFS transporter
MERSRYLVLTLVLGALTALPPFSTDTSLPAMPAMADGLGTSQGAIQLTLSAYFFGGALGQVVIGPLADRFGRKPVLMLGLLVYVVASLGCAFAGSVEMLMVMRFLQGSTTATGRILPRAIARDMFDREEGARLLSYMMVVGGIGPIVAPILGGHLSGWFGWQAVFVYMTGYGVLAMILSALWLRESLPAEHRIPLHPPIMARNFLMILTDRTFLSYGACVVCTQAGLFAFLSGSSSALIRFMGETPQQFGFDFAMVMVGGIVFNAIAGRLVGRLGLDRLLAAGAVLAAVAGLFMAALGWGGIDRVWAIVAPMCAYMAAYALVVPTATAGALSPFPRLAGTAASFLGFLQTVFSAAVTMVLGLIDDTTQIAMVTAVALMGTGILVSRLALVRPLRRRAAT